MRVSTMIRSGVVGIAIAALAACADAPVAPTQARNTGLQPNAAFSASRGGRGGAGLGARAGRSDPRRYADAGTTLDSTTFSLTSNGGTYAFGENVLYVAKGALCDLSSPYGSAYFNDASSCVQPAAPIQVTAYWGKRDGHAYVEFSPELRFNPADDAPQAVLALFDRATAHSNIFQIFWRNESGVWIDEALTDPTLKSYRFGPDVIARRIKHFSGYNVSASFTDTSLMY